MIESTENKYFPWFTTLFSLLLSVIFIVMASLSGSLSINSQLYEWFGAPYATQIFLGKIYGVVTNNFIHVNLLHLSINLVGLWLFGAFLERRLGWFKMAMFGLVSSIFGSIIQLSFSDDAGLGIASAIFGMFTLILVMSLRDERFKMKYIYIFGLVMLSILVFMIINNQLFNEDTAIEAKIGGVFWGFLVGISQRDGVIQKPFLLALFIPFTLVSIMLAYSPWSSQWNCARAILYHEKHDLATAEQYYKIALNLDAKNQLAASNYNLIKIDRLSALAYNAHKSGEYTEARRYYFKILSLDKNHRWAKENLKDLP